MDIFMSDLHMTDSGGGGAVSETQLISFVERVRRFSEEDENHKVRLILVGDIFDLLRSDKWTALWNERTSAPWSAMSKNFKHFDNSFALTESIEIMRKICGRYAGFGKKVRELVGEKKLETVYLPGNHDFMVQLSSKLRELVVEFFGLAHDAKKPFKTTYANKSASVFAVHGNSFDPINWHRQPEGFWAMGDAVVLRIVNRFAEAACKRIGCSIATELGQLLQEIDNIEPLVDIPIYVRWLTDENLTIKDSRDEVLATWREVVEDFLELKEFRDDRGYGDKAFKWLRRAFELSITLGVGDLISKLSRLFPNAGTNYQSAAETEAKKNSGYRFVLFGHTHKPTMQPLTYAPENDPHFYVNTGCWRRLVTRVTGQGPSRFAGRRVASYFVTDESAEEEKQERYHLFQEWHTS